MTKKSEPTVNICIYADDEYPVYYWKERDHSAVYVTSVSIPLSQYRRWVRVMEEYTEIQREMEELYNAKEE